MEKETNRHVENNRCAEKRIMVKNKKLKKREKKNPSKYPNYTVPSTQ